MATISPSELEYQKSHINDSRVPEIIAAFAVCLPLAYIAVILRFTSRRIGKIALKADDYWVIIALVSHHITVAMRKQPGHFAEILGNVAFHIRVRHMRDLYHTSGSWPPCHSLEASQDLCEGL